MKIGYGIAVQESDDPYISIAEEALNGVAQASIPGAFWVDLFPILKYVPSWFPGAGFQKKAARWREAINTMADKPFHHVQEQFVRVLFFWKEIAHELLVQLFYRRITRLFRPWQQTSLSVFLMRAILKDPGKKALRKMCFS